jgi:membrane glycosyltransferase
MVLNSRTIGVLAVRRRLFLSCLVICLALVGAIPMAGTLALGGWTILKVSFFAIFLVLQIQVAFGFAGAMLGWWLLRSGCDKIRINCQTMPSALPAELPAVAIVMPVYNEEVSRIFLGLKIMYESLQQTGWSEGFDFFILSDTSDLNCWIAEEKAWFELCKQVNAFGRIFYRKRRVQLHNKSGNIADFCRRWGANYRYMIVLDADSVMTGASFVQLTRLMEENNRVGIIQTSPRPILGRSLFQRIEQFAAWVYRPVFAAGANFWQLGDATFWGHNAIVRLKPFIQYCAMPELPEVGPLGKRVLSHDTIEAALMRRAGYQVWQAYDLEGSYEESPPHLLASLQRDRRWCHGNLQHLWFLFERGIKTVSRFNILNGIMAYSSSPLWLLSLILGVLVTMNQDHGAAGALARMFRPGIVSGALYAYVMCLLLLPKVLGAAILMKSTEKLKLCGGGIKVALGVAAETIHSMVMAPVLMLFYTRFVLASFSGTEVRWGRQVRSDAQGPSWTTWIATHASNLVLVLIAAVMTAWLRPSLLLWLAPVLAGPILAVPVSRMTASTNLGLEAKTRGWFVIPEEVAPPGEVAKLEERVTSPQNILLGSREYAPDYGLLQAVLDPYINSVHVSLLRLRTESSVRTRENMTLLADRLLLQGPNALTSAEKKALLWDAEAMLAMHETLWSSPASHLHEWWQTAFRHYVESSALSIRRTVHA